MFIFFFKQKTAYYMRISDWSSDVCSSDLTSVATIEREGNGFRVRSAGNGNAPGFAVDLVVHAAGRVPAIDAEQLDRAGVAHDKGRLSLNEFLQSRTNPLVYAAGDAAQMAPPLTPVELGRAHV